MSSTGEEVSTQNFGIIEWYDYNRKASGFVERLRYLDIKLSDWLFRAIDAAEVLPISRDYFRIRRPIDRRVYEIARKHCGKQISWKISIGLLQKKCGSRQAEQAFRGASARTGGEQCPARLRRGARFGLRRVHASGRQTD